MPKLTWTYVRQEIEANRWGIGYIIFLYGVLVLYTFTC